MDKYKILKLVGDGAYGQVYKAVNKNNGDIVAIKKMKRRFSSWEECMRLRELKSLRKLSHPNIIKLKEVIRIEEEVFFIFEFMEKNIYQLIKDTSEELTNKRIKHLIYQALCGLEYTHKQGFFHRDMKPENLLLSGDALKIADFGLAREIKSLPPYTDYVATRWYRAPEVLLHSTNYNTPIDIFALGAIMAELYMRRPLFPGNNEHDQLIKECTILGSPSAKAWPEGHRLANLLGFVFPNSQAVNLKKLIPNAPTEALELIQQMLNFDALKRPTASECLKHPFFSEFRPVTKQMPQLDKEDFEKTYSTNRTHRILTNKYQRESSEQSRAESEYTSVRASLVDLLKNKKPAHEKPSYNIISHQQTDGYLPAVAYNTNNIYKDQHYQNKHTINSKTILDSIPNQHTEGYKTDLTSKYDNFNQKRLSNQFNDTANVKNIISDFKQMNLIQHPRPLNNCATICCPSNLPKPLAHYNLPFLLPSKMAIKQHLEPIKIDREIEIPIIPQLN